MHPLLKLLLLNTIVSYAAGQQSFYSINGQQHGSTQQQYVSQPNPNPPYVPANYQANTYNNGYNYGVTSQTPTQASYAAPVSYPTQQPYAAYPVQATSQTLQSYSYAPATYNQYSSGVQSYGSQSAATSSQLTYQPPTPYTNYASPSAIPSTTHQQPQLVSQPQQQSYGSPTIAQSYPSTVAQPQFSQRQLYYGPPPQQPVAIGIPYGTAPVKIPAPAAAPTTSATPGQPTPAGPGISSQQFMSRRGPFNGMITRAKEWMPGLKKNRGKGSSYTPGMGEMNRVPKPPKYPLYDMAGMGMATPPPPPLMSPMAQMPSNIFSNFANPPGSSSGVPQRGGRPSQPPSSGGKSHPPRRGKGGSNANKRRRNRPPPPPPPPPAPKYRNNKRQRPRGNAPNKGRNNYSNKVPVTEGFDHPMASNIAAASSPPLGRPLGYDEYMKRPTHSFTDDPWNFDPNAQSYNEGMNTHAMKYNYDPLGTNALDTSIQTHLDITKMSYPGDAMNMEIMKEPPKPLHSQLGGWDLPPSVYRSGQPSDLPTGGSSSSSSSSNSGASSSSSNSNTNSNTNSNSGSFSRFDDQRQDSSAVAFEEVQVSSTARNSFNQQYDPTTEASIVRSETLSPITLISGSDGAIEFDIDTLKTTSSGSSSNNNNNNYNSNGNNYNSNANNYNSNSNSNSNSNNNNYNSNSNNNYNSNSNNYNSNSDDYSRNNNNNNYNSNTNSNYNNNYNSNSNNYNNNPNSYSNNNYKNNNNNNYNSNSNYNEYRLSDHYSPAGESHVATQQQQQQQQQNNYDNHPSSTYSSSYSSRTNDYGTRRTRANPQALHNKPHHHVHSSNVHHRNSPISSVTEGLELFHDFIKDPNPGSGKARARQHLYKALLS